MPKYSTNEVHYNEVVEYGSEANCKMLSELVFVTFIIFLTIIFISYSCIVMRLFCQGSDAHDDSVIEDGNCSLVKIEMEYVGNINVDINT